MSHGGKGCAQRPSQIDSKQFDNNWEQIFGNKEVQKDKPSNLNNHNPTENQTYLPDMSSY